MKGKEHEEKNVSVILTVPLEESAYYRKLFDLQRPNYWKARTFIIEIQVEKQKQTLLIELYSRLYNKFL